MKKKKHRFRAKQPGLSPGSLVRVGVASEIQSQAKAFHFSATNLVEEHDIGSIDLGRCRDGAATTWIDITGLQDLSLIQGIGETFDLHSLLLEDLVNTFQRPKIEEYEGHLFMLLKMVEYDAAARTLKLEQLSLILGRSWLLTFQERPGDVFGPVRDRLRAGRGRLRSFGADYLAYALMDAVVDHYFVVMEALTDRVEELEAALTADPTSDILRQIHGLKQEMVYLRRAVLPLREVVGSIERAESPLIQERTRVFLRDLYDHTIQIIDQIDNCRELLSGLQDLYLSIAGNRMNEVMKVLTIVATIFIPLTFIAGIYGMNFKYIPELEWQWGYFGVWALMLAVAAIMAAYFRRRKWL